MNSGIYTIVNEVNGKSYIGSACSFRKRWATHRSDLKKGTHHSTYLQRAWNKYGEENFYFGVLEPVENKEDLVAREQFWLDTLKPEYNISPTAGSSLGARQSEETIQKKTGENNYWYKHAKRWEYNGKVRSLSDWAKEFGFTLQIIQNRVNSKGWSIERALTTPVTANQKGDNSTRYKQAKHWEYNGKSQPLSDWAREYNISISALNSRLGRGWSFGQALNTPLYSQAKLWKYKGESKPMSYWARKCGINQTTLDNRVGKLGWSLEKALTTPVKTRRPKR